MSVEMAQNCVHETNIYVLFVYFVFISDQNWVENTLRSNLLATIRY
jgi:hypothetical protein